MTKLAENPTTEACGMPGTEAGEAPKGYVALLVDHPWSDLKIEQAVFQAAGIRFVAGPQSAGTPTEIEYLVRSVDPDAILTCAAPVSATAIAAPRKLRVVARLGAGVDDIAVDAASLRGAWVTHVPDYCVAEELRERACQEVVRVLCGSPPRNPCNQPLVGAALEGGVSSEVRVVDGPSGPEVIKVALPKLKVAADWFSDPARSNIEVAAIGVFASLIGADAVPRILWSRPEQHAFAMRLVDPRLRNWKKDLLAGRVDLGTAHRVGELLGRLHLVSGTRPDIRQQFLDTKYFDELRLEPFFLRIAATDPELGPLVKVIGEGMRSRRSALVHGDYSPKNILADGGEVVILDFEVAHWGDPRFDVGFCASHLLLKAIRATGATRNALATSIDTFFDAYFNAGPAVFDRDLMQIMGGLLLARIQGASPVDYLNTADIPKVRDVAAAMIREPERFVGTSATTWSFER